MAHPNEAALRAALVEPARRVAGDSRRQDRAFQLREGERQPFEQVDHLVEARFAVATRVDPVPIDQEAREHVAVDRGDLTAKTLEGAALDATQDLWIDPFRLTAAGIELPRLNLAAGRERGEHGFELSGNDTNAIGDRARRERAVGARMSCEQLLERRGARGQERLREGVGEYRAERVPVEPGLLRRDPGRTTHDVHLDRPPRPRQLLERRRRVALEARFDLVRRQRPDTPQQIVDPVRVSRLRLGVEPLPPRLDAIDDVGIEQLAQRLGAEQLAKHVPIEGEGLGAPLGGRHVELVEVVRGVGEDEVASEGRRRTRFDVVDANLARTNPRHQVNESR